MKTPVLIISGRLKGQRGWVRGKLLFRTDITRRLVFLKGVGNVHVVGIRHLQEDGPREPGEGELL